jgi:hypothetical protein
MSRTDKTTKSLMVILEFKIMLRLNLPASTVLPSSPGPLSSQQIPLRMGMVLLHLKDVTKCLVVIHSCVQIIVMSSSLPSSVPTAGIYSRSVLKTSRREID